MDPKDLMPRISEEVEEGAPHWFVTFADMMTLLLGFFILLVSFANQDLAKFKQLMGGMRDAFGARTEQTGGAPPAGSSLTGQDPYAEILRQAEARVQIAPKEGAGQISILEMKQVGSIVESVFQELNAQGVDVEETEEGVVVRVQGQLMFEPGAAEIRQEGQPVIEMVSRLMGRYNLDLHIMGHTDNAPISTARYPSNWELSSARASAVLRYLVEKGADPRRLVAVGFADSRPLADNLTPDGRSKNRRVEFLFRPPQRQEGAGLAPASP